MLMWGCRLSENIPLKSILPCYKEFMMDKTCLLSSVYLLLSR